MTASNSQSQTERETNFRIFVFSLSDPDPVVIQHIYSHCCAIYCLLSITYQYTDVNVVFLGLGMSRQHVERVRSRILEISLHVAQLWSVHSSYVGCGKIEEVPGFVFCPLTPAFCEAFIQSKANVYNLFLLNPKPAVSTECLPSLF